jgi:hypothetical protein
MTASSIAIRYMTHVITFRQVFEHLIKLFNRKNTWNLYKKLIMEDHHLHKKTEVLCNDGQWHSFY